MKKASDRKSDIIRDERNLTSANTSKISVLVLFLSHHVPNS